MLYSVCIIPLYIRHMRIWHALNFISAPSSYTYLLYCVHAVRIAVKAIAVIRRGGGPVCSITPQHTHAHTIFYQVRNGRAGAGNTTNLVKLSAMVTSYGRCCCVIRNSSHNIASPPLRLFLRRLLYCSPMRRALSNVLPPAI